jgi:hypothetical protein
MTRLRSAFDLLYQRSRERKYINYMRYVEYAEYAEYVVQNMSLAYLD